MAELTTKERDDMLQELAAPAAAIAPAAPAVKTKQLGRRRNSGLLGGKRSGGRWAGTFDSKAGRGRRNGRRPRGWRTRGDTGSAPVPDWPRQLSFDPHLMGESLRGLPSLPRPAPAPSANFADPSSLKLTVDELKAGRADVDPTKKEQYLSDADFEKVMKSPRSEFNAMKGWKQQQIKKAAGLY